jgi:hypothetical protein
MRIRTALSPLDFSLDLNGSLPLSSREAEGLGLLATVLAMVLECSLSLSLSGRKTEGFSLLATVQLMRGLSLRLSLVSSKQEQVV